MQSPTFEEIAEYYDNCADRIEVSSRYSRVKSIVEFLLFEINPSQDVLDIGCGAGDVVGCLRSNNINAIGIDISPKLVERAIERFGPYFNVLNIVDFKGGSKFDFISFCDCLEHIPKVYHLQIVENIKNHLNVGARLFVSIPTERTQLGLTKDSAQIVDETITEDYFKELFKDFKVIYDGTINNKQYKLWLGEYNG